MARFCSGTSMPQRVLALMSGGVDSSTAAAILSEEGFEVIGITMRVWDDTDSTMAPDPPCTSDTHVEDARLVCARLNIPHRVSDARAVFRRRVVDPFCREYLSGRTPNPCVVCNTEIKFGAMPRRTRALDADYVATGHYARIRHDAATGRYLLLKGKDTAKDQSYFLHNLTQRQLAHILFPMGELTKVQARRKARELELPVAEKDESQEICFVPGGDYRTLLELLMPGRMQPGPIVDVNGTKLGNHGGIACYTIGQRRGLGISHPRPLYVVGFDVETNAVIVGTSEHLWARELTAEKVNWVSIPKLQEPMRTCARIRYRHEESPATVAPLERGRVLVTFERPQRAITPGQSVVFYDDDVVVGGGVIDSVARSS